MRRSAILALAVCALGPAWPEPVAAEGGDVEAGGRLWRGCVACHTAGRGEPHRAGPNLWGIVGAPAAAKAGYRYSRALAAAGLVWDEATLDAWLRSPRTLVPGNLMIHAGLARAEDRADIIAFLRANGPAGDR
ncbi:MAG: c-type cytochrome [Alphaproteobacteria bacterium]|nr:c-type cytochrome [Alphaproteobacteria bacterium]